MLSAKKSSNVIVHFDSLFCHSNGGLFFIGQIVVPLLPVLLEFISKWFSARLSEKLLGPAGPQVLIFGHQNKYSSRQKLHVRTNRIQY